MKEIQKSNKNKTSKKIYFLCNPEVAVVLPDYFEAITDLDTFNQLRAENEFLPNGVLGLIIQAEIVWEENRYYTDFWAMDFVYRLRVEWSMKYPMILTSTYPSISMAGLENALNRMDDFHHLQDPAIQFIPLIELLETSETEIDTSFPKPIRSDMLLEDLKEHLYKKIGFLFNFFNDLQNEIYGTNPPTTNTTIQTFFDHKIDALEKVLNKPTLIQEVRSLFQKRFQSESAIDAEELSNLVYRFKRTVFNNQAAAGSAREELPDELVILYVSSLPNPEVGKFEQQLKRHCRLTFVSNSAAAVDYLKNDKEGTNIILCDFRFLQENGQWCEEQGYDILETIYEAIPNIYYPVILSNLEDAGIYQIVSGKLQPRVFSKRKMERNNPRFDRFLRLIMESDTQIKKEKEKLPNFGQGLKVYIQHLQSKDYEVAEAAITQQAMDFLKLVLIKPDKVVPLQNLRGRLTGSDTNRNIKNLRNLLLCRRIALGLYQMGGSVLDYPEKKENAKRWSAIYAWLKFGYTNKHLGQTDVETFMRHSLMKMSKKIDYSWRNINALKLTPKEKEWLQLYGPGLESHNI